MLRSVTAGLWRRFLAFLDDVLPMSPVDRARRDGARVDDSARHRLWLKLYRLQKRGRGGFR